MLILNYSVLSSYAKIIKTDVFHWEEIIAGSTFLTIINSAFNTIHIAKHFNTIHIAKGRVQKLN